VLEYGIGRLIYGSRDGSDTAVVNQDIPDAPLWGEERSMIRACRISIFISKEEACGLFWAQK
jgi:hypothetical protein